MSKPIFPVSASTPPSSHFTPSESRWGVHSVALLVGVGVLGLLAYAIFFRSRAESSSDLITPPDSPERHFEPITRTFDHQHSSQMLHRGKPCLNEAQQLNFDYFAEGGFIIRLDALFPSLEITGNADITVRCRYEGKEFFVHREKIMNLSPVRFFMPNMPFNQLMNLTIEIDQAGKKTSKAIDQFVVEKSGIYDINNEDACTPTPLPTVIKTIVHTLSDPRPIEPSSFFDIALTAVHEIEIKGTLSNYIVIRAPKILTVAYLKIVHEDPVAKKKVALALHFYFDINAMKLFTPSALIQQWRDAYFQATQQEAPADLKLVLSEVKFIAYLEEESD